MKAPRSKTLLTTIIALAIATATAGCATRDADGTSPSPASSTNVATPSSPSSRRSKNADGTYTATGQYGGLPSSIGVSVTLVADVITAVTTPELAARIATAIEQRLTVVLEVAEQALETHPSRSSQRVFSRPRAACSGESLGDTLRAGVEVALCLVELRGFEPLTPCMPLMGRWVHNALPTFRPHIGAGKKVLLRVGS
jgi:uncharacterized protein with FMN-binding domain